MALQLSVAVRNARLDAIETTIGASAKLRILTGAPPADCATAQSGTLLAELALPSDYLSNASSGSKVKSGTWSGTGSASGTAGYFRIVDSTGTTCHMQGTVTATGGGGDMTLDNTSIASSQAITVNTFSVSDANA
jgi:hypothetical protein